MLTLMKGLTMKTYNGHRSWNAWNVSLWMGNDESIYTLAINCIARAKQHYEGKSWSSAGHIIRKATRLFMQCYGGQKTPDGAIYNALSIKLALQGFIED